MLSRLLFVSILVGSLAACEIRMQGDNTFGQLGDPINTFITTFSVSGDDWTKISAGGFRTCGIRGETDELWCWGGFTSPALNTPAQPSTMTGWTDVSVGRAHVCAIRAGELWCWGFNSNGQLGLGDTTDRFSPTRVGISTVWEQVSAGDLHTCGVTQFGSLLCWGSDLQGQANIFPWDGVDILIPQFVRVLDGSFLGKVFIEVSAGYRHTCAEDSSGEIFCFGEALSSPGIGAYEQVPRPAGVVWDTISVGSGYSCATTAPEEPGAPIPSNRLYCWGDNTSPQYNTAPGAASFYTQPQLIGSAVFPIGGGFLNVDNYYPFVDTGPDFLCAVNLGNKVESTNPPSTTYNSVQLVSCIGDNPFVDDDELNASLPTTPGTALWGIAVGERHVGTILTQP